MKSSTLRSQSFLIACALGTMASASAAHASILCSDFHLAKTWGAIDDRIAQVGQARDLQAKILEDRIGALENVPSWIYQSAPDAKELADLRSSIDSTLSGEESAASNSAGLDRSLAEFTSKFADVHRLIGASAIRETDELKKKARWYHLGGDEKSEFGIMVKENKTHIAIYDLEQGFLRRLKKVVRQQCGFSERAQPQDTE